MVKKNPRLELFSERAVSYRNGKRIPSHLWYVGRRFPSGKVFSVGGMYDKKGDALKLKNQLLKKRSPPKRKRAPARKSTLQHFKHDFMGL